MGACTQTEIDRIVERCGNAATTVDSDKLAEVCKWYEIFHRCREHGAMIALEIELEAVGC